MKNKNSLKVRFLGGVGEIGKNMTALEYGKDIIIIDAGLTFPSTDMPGVDLVIPDITYLNQNKDRIKGMILHSDQGYQYQLKAYHTKLKELEIIQSMSRKGNCLNNSPTENFFGRLKTEIFYDKEYEYESIDQLKKAVEAYIKYYNEERIVVKYGDSPIRVRLTYQQRC
jgi:transposase InsO family protein